MVEIRFTLGNDPAGIAPVLDHLETQLRNLDPGRTALLGIAVHEALCNAILHGNLEVSSRLREEDEAAFHRLAEQRRRQSPFRDRRVYFTARIAADEIRFVVRDEGFGFDPNSLPDPTDPANLEKPCGRGLLLIQMIMDRVEHNHRGNEITMIKRAA